MSIRYVDIDVNEYWTKMSIRCEGILFSTRSTN